MLPFKLITPTSCTGEGGGHFMQGGGHEEPSARWESDVLVGCPVEGSDWMEGPPTEQYYLVTSAGRNSLGTDGTSAALSEVSESGLQSSKNSFFKNKTLMFLSGL